MTYYNRYFRRHCSPGGRRRFNRRKKDITPYWRTLKEGGVLNEKYPGGVEAQAARLRQEGHVVEAKGKKTRVVGFEKALA